MTSPLERAAVLALFAFAFMHIPALAGANEDSTLDVFMTPTDKTSKLPRINPSYLGKVDKSGNLVRGTKACLYNHEKREEITRALLMKNKGKPTKRILRKIRKALGRRRFKAWKKYTTAMKALGRNGKCGLVWNKASGLYSACCVFRVGMNDSAAQLSCLAPWSVGQAEPSPESRIRPEFGLHYGFEDIDASLPGEEKEALRKEIERSVGSPQAFGFVKDEGKFQTKMLRDLMEKVQTETPEQLGKDVLDRLLEKENDRLRLRKCNNLTGTDREVYSKIHIGLSNDIQKATACLAKARENDGQKQQQVFDFNTIALECQHTLSAVLALHREAILELAIRCDRCVSGNCLDDPRDASDLTSGIWELNFFDQTWTWNFDYGAYARPSLPHQMSAETSAPRQGATSMPENLSSGRCTQPETAYYSLCCDSVLALSRLCQQLHQNAP